MIAKAPGPVHMSRSLKEALLTLLYLQVGRYVGLVPNGRYFKLPQSFKS